MRMLTFCLYAFIAAFAFGALTARDSQADCNPSSCTDHGNALTCVGCDADLCTYHNGSACAMARLQHKLASVEIDQYDNIVIGGTNVYITDGTSSVSYMDSSAYWATTNNTTHLLDAGGSSKDYQLGSANNPGKGNLILGYNWLSSSTTIPQNTRSGGHNLIIGDGNYFAGGYSILGGIDNYATASSSYGSILSGMENILDGGNACIVGGYQNYVTDDVSVVVGGSENVANGAASVVVGGFQNTASGMVSAVLGGMDNVASGNEATVSGGTNNTASSAYAHISAGDGNTADVQGGVICGDDGQTSSIDGYVLCHDVP